MSHNWGIEVAALPVEVLIEIRDKLKAGEIKISFADAGLATDAQVITWVQEITSQLVEAYDAELKRRYS